MSSFFHKHQKLFTIITTVVFILSLIPIFLIAGYDCAAGDDYNFGAQPHLAYLATGSVWAAIVAAFKYTISVWHGWQGTWFDCFLFCLHPEVFSDSAYVIVPYIFVIMRIVCFMIFAHHFLKVRWKFSGSFWYGMGLMFLLFVFQLVPSQKSAFFWWVGAIHYTMPICLCLLGIVTADRWLLEHKVRFLVYLSIIATLMGGATYPAALLLLLSSFLLWLEGFVLAGKRDKKDFFLLIPLVLELIGLIISVIAPGNAVRSASELNKDAVPSGGPIATIIKSILFSVEDAFSYFIKEKTFVLILFILVGIISKAAIKAACKRDNAFCLNLFSHPLLFVLVMFLLNASMYAPRLYAGGVVSSGYFNFNFEVFCMCMVASIIYVAGYLESHHNELHFPKFLNIVWFVAILIAAYMGRHGVKLYTDYLCMDYYMSGQADDYKNQMALQRLLMEEEGVDDVVVPEINDMQGPLMHMPIVADPDNVDNYMTQSFYGKNSCRSIPRPEWMEIYGEKYGYTSP